MNVQGSENRNDEPSSRQPSVPVCPAADFTPTEAIAAFTAFRKTVSAKSDIHLSLSMHRYGGDNASLCALFRPGGDDACHIFYAETWRDLLTACEARWAETSDLHAANITREMALKIIAITADLGECTDAALRADFDAADVERYGEAACAKATEMAANGPFSIVRMSGANAEAA